MPRFVSARTPLVASLVAAVLACAGPGAGTPPWTGGERWRLVLDVYGEESGPSSEPGREQRRLELVYREQRDADAVHLVLAGLRHEARGEPAVALDEVIIEADRLRIVEGGRVAVDLEGPHPREPLTPARLIHHPFVRLRSAAEGRPPVASPVGTPAAVALHRALRLPRSVAWARPADPPVTVREGSRWTALRVPLHPPGPLAPRIELHHEVTGVSATGCARVAIRADRDERRPAGVRGPGPERMRVRVRGEARVELRGDRPRTVHLALEDDVRATFRATASEEPVRLRYRAFAELVREEPKGGPCAHPDPGP